MNSIVCRSLFCCVFLTVSSAVAQVDVPGRMRDAGLRESVYGLGFSAGAATGLGLSFRHHLPGSTSYQLVGGVIKTGGDMHYSIGAALFVDVARSSINRIYVGGGVSYFYSGTEQRNAMEGPGRAGVGIGGEYVLQGGLHLSGELLFTYFTDGTVLPLPQVSLFYYFY